MGSQEAELLTVAVDAARAGAAELIARYGSAPRDVRSKSGPTDLVSAADLASEHAIRELLARERPADAVLGEEGGASAGESDIRWVVDPLDGTINYLYEIPLFCVSVACEDADGAVAGVVLDPLRDELFVATRSGPPLLNGEPISGSEREQLSMALVSTGFSYDRELRARQARVVAGLLPEVRDVRRGGAAALDMSWCACGRVDAYYERSVKPWDIAAGSLICERAGLAVRTMQARDGFPGGVMTAPPAMIDAFAALVD